MVRAPSQPPTPSREDHELSRALLAWYGRAKRDLPWRQNTDPYRVWLSEIMLQQTRVETVIPYYERFLARFPRLEDLAAAEEDEVLTLWSGLGYYRRARSLWAGARAVVAEHDGRFPGDWKEALALPGIGPYTAAAILSIAHGKPHAVVDGNVERVVTRLRRLADSPKEARVARAIREHAEAWLTASCSEGVRAGDFNQAMMEFGATICLPRSPHCEACPLEAHCEARAAGEVERFPEMAPKRAVEKIELEAGLLEHRGRYLLEQCRGLGFLEGLWVFPLGATDGLAARLSGELEREIAVGDALPAVKHSITFRRLSVAPRRLESPGRWRKLPGDHFRWARLDELGESLPVPSLTKKIAARLG